MGPALPGDWLPLPSSVTTAARLMFTGGGLSAFGTIAGLAAAHALQVMVAQQHPAAAWGADGAAVAILLIRGVIGTALWLWLARETRRGRRRARAWATAVFCIATVTGVGIGAHAPATGLIQAFSGIEWVIGLCAVVLLWTRPSRSYYAAQRPPAVYPPVFSPSPSLRPRQFPPGQPDTRQDWQARPGWPGQGPPDRGDPQGQRPGQGPGQVSWSRPSQPDRPGQRR